MIDLKRGFYAIAANNLHLLPGYYCYAKSNAAYQLWKFERPV